MELELKHLKLNPVTVTVTPVFPVALVSVKHAASYVAFKMVRCNVYVLCWCVFPHPLSFFCLWQGVETRFSVLSMQFRAWHSRANKLLYYTSFVHMPEIYLAC